MRDPLIDDLPILSELGDDLRAAFARHDTRGGIPPARRRLRPRTRWSLVALTAALAAAAVAFVLALQGGSTLPPPAAAALYRAAEAAERQSLAFPADNQFYFVRSISGSWEIIPMRQQRPLSRRALATAPRAYVQVEQNQWTSADRIGFNRFRTLSVRFANRAARQAWVHAGRPHLGASGTGREGTLGRGLYLLGNVELTRQAFLRFTTKPRELYRKLYAAGGSPHEVFVEIGDELRNRPAPGPLRAALYRTLALVPGIHLVGSTRDSVGRRGVAVSFTQNGLADELIFDPRTATMLEERTIVVNPAEFALGLARGSVTDSTTYLQRAVTNSVGTR